MVITSIVMAEFDQPGDVANPARGQLTMGNE